MNNVLLIVEGPGAPPATRQLRKLVRHRAKLFALRSGSRPVCTQCWPSRASNIPLVDVFGVRGRTLLEQAPLDGPYRARVNSLCRMIDALTFEIDVAAHLVAVRLAADPGYRAIQAIPGVGPTLARRSSWPRSGMSTASPAPVTCVRGPGARSFVCLIPAPLRRVARLIDPARSRS